MEVRVVCTGRGSHKRHTFNQLTTDGDQVTMRQVRIANMPELAAIKFDGVAMETRAVMPPYEPRTGHDSWRWTCPHCDTRCRLSTVELREWLQGRRVADISRRT